MRSIHAIAVAAAAIGFAAPAFAQGNVKIPNIIELSGAGATVGTNWKNGSSLAVDEINAAGGLLGKKIQLEFVDTASDPGKAQTAETAA
jgi:branched-chain amino acid transport system substrate-binding protein